MPWPENQRETAQVILDRIRSTDHVEHAQQGAIAENERIGVATDSGSKHAGSVPQEAPDLPAQRKDIEKQLDDLEKRVNKKVLKLWMDRLTVVNIGILTLHRKQSSS